MHKNLNNFPKESLYSNSECGSRVCVLSRQWNIILSTSECNKQGQTNRHRHTQRKRERERGEKEKEKSGRYRERQLYRQIGRQANRQRDYRD